MEYFVRRDSIVREIWGKSDTVLFIFAGSAAEFALNKAVDWLYFTGKLPADPLGRLFSTVSYARRIIFMPWAEATRAIGGMNAAHKGIEEKRGRSIPQWAYRDVLYMLIDYSVTAYEVLERPLTTPEKEEVYDVFRRVGEGMTIQDLPGTYREWLPDRARHLQNNLAKGPYTVDLYKQYRKHIGGMRYWLLLQVQQLICPGRVRELLGLRPNPVIPPALSAYKLSRLLRADRLLKALFLPPDYKQEIRALDYDQASEDFVKS